MRLINYPFKNVNFNRGTSVFIDACFLLTLLDDKSRKFTECTKISRILYNNSCQLYISPLISAETVNRLIIALFVKDIRLFTIGSNKTLNNKKHLNSILQYFSKDDKNLLAKESEVYLDKINFKKYFDKIYKSGNSKLLKVYFQKAVELEKILENRLHIKYVSINKQTVINARDYIAKNLMGVNDAFHLAITVQNNIDYLLTLDKDFKRLKLNNNKVTLLKI
ncbi:PIN domain-containing protein (plasmid) [Thermoanaerobacterium thermosaccharolyticum]|uniref:type II toxin-antitoxin system VapC family toxin n=1 Tax=Thermoanaerobacterium thermosaccharolyticum TaxID=1517 RepID=UPI003DA83827